LADILHLVPSLDKFIVMAHNDFMHQSFGPHLMLDLFGCPAPRLANLEFVNNILETFPAQISMTTIMPPHVFEYHGQAATDWGISGVIVTAESHITIHTFPETQHVFIDIFSSKDFDIDAARDKLLKLFGANSHEVALLNRGSGMARNIKCEPPSLVGSHQTFR